MTPRRPHARMARRPQPRTQARWPEVCPPVVIGPMHGCIVSRISRESHLMTTARGPATSRRAPLRRLPTIQKT
jgi:hypothetical protein